MCIAFPAPLEANGDQEFNRTMERPFNSEQKFMAVSGTLKSDPSSRERCFMKGSIESVLERCKFYFVSEDSTPALDPSTRALISKKAADAASRGLRVIALAYGFGSVPCSCMAQCDSANSLGTSSSRVVRQEAYVQRAGSLTR